MGELGRHTRRASALALVALVAGCGADGDDYVNEARAPSPITVSAAVTDASVLVEPRRFGAGPIVLVVSNQTDRARAVTFETDEIGGPGPGVRQTTSPINPDGTAALELELRPGRYRLTAEGGRAEGAAIRVGARRMSAQDELLLP